MGIMLDPSKNPFMGPGWAPTAESLQNPLFRARINPRSKTPLKKSPLWGHKRPPTAKSLESLQISLIWATVKPPNPQRLSLIHPLSTERQCWPVPNPAWWTKPMSSSVLVPSLGSKSVSNFTIKAQLRRLDWVLFTSRGILQEEANVIVSLTWDSTEQLQKTLY